MFYEGLSSVGGNGAPNGNATRQTEKAPRRPIQKNPTFSIKRNVTVF
jgi:hypothetical protein